MFKRNDWIVGIFSVLLGAFAIFQSLSWPEHTSVDPAGQRYVPVALAWGIIIIGITHLVGCWVERRKGNSNNSKTDFTKELSEIKPLLQITLVSIIYILTLKTMGYLIVTPLLLATILWIVKERRIKNLITTSIGVTGVLFIVFYFGLQVKLPLGLMKGLF